MVTMVLSLVILMAFLGLSIDVGYVQYIKTCMQGAADAGALGGAQELHASGSSNMVTSAMADASTNGFTNGQNSVSITVNNPPATGYSTADATAVEVLISQSVPTFFMQVLGFSSVTIQVRSVAHQGGGGTTCFYALDPSMSSALSVSNGVTATFACGVMIDSSSTTALNVTGGSHLNAPYIGVTGNYTVNNGSSISPAPAVGVSPVSNPLSALPKPAVGACTFTGTVIGGGVTTTLGPGTYCKGLTIGNGATVTLNAGMYVFEGGGFNINGGAHVTGTGVTFYNSYAAGSAYQPFTFNNGTTITLTAPTTGSYAGILLYQDPTVVSSAVNTFAGGASLNLTGTLYFPTTGISISNGVNAAYTIIVADNITFTGGVTLNNNYSSLPGGSPIKGSIGFSE
jgi:hypothetical protein